MRSRCLVFGVFMLVLAGASVGAPPLLRAQVAPVPAPRDLPGNVRDTVLARLNDPSATLRQGDFHVPSGMRIATDLAVLDGDLHLEGTVLGDVLVVNGDAHLAGGSTVSGDLLVIGGEVTGSPTPNVAGTTTTYSDRIEYERVGGRVLEVRGPRMAATISTEGGRSDFLIATGKSYNRVEGMPIAFGPRLETDGSNPLRLQALAIYRTETGLRFAPEEMGYYVRAEQYIGGHRDYRVGAALHSFVEPIEEWHMTDLESGLATFLFRRDFRDHYQRQGGSAFATWEPSGTPYQLHVEGRWEKHGTRGAGSPWSLFGNADEWRPQPVVAEGGFGSVVLQGSYDTRSYAWNPSSGVLARAQLEHAFRVDLAHPEMFTAEAPGDPEAVGAPSYPRFLTGLFDLRSYNRVNAQSRLNLRLVGGGSLTGDPLPPQRQHALGGEGSLPGYDLFTSDCGARGVPVVLPADHDSPDGQRFFPHYGCDAFGLLQAEFRGKLSFRFRWDAGPWREGNEDSDRIWDFGWDMAPDWSIFVDAGRGWTFHDRPDDATRVNVGGGLLLERFGIYLAVPVTGGSGVNVFIRLGPRF